MSKTGKEYEIFVAELQKAIIDAETITTQKNIQIEVDKKIKDNCGIERQFDIYWEYELAGITYKTIIECKDYNSNISVEKIDALIGKIKDIPDLKAVFATKKGYQSGAKTKANHNRIDLLIVREQNDSDWFAEDGTPLIKKVLIDMCVRLPADIHSFEPIIDKDWIKENTNIDTQKNIHLSAMNNEIFIENIDKNEKFSLQELSNKLYPSEGKEFGVFEKIEELNNSFISYRNLRLKLSGYKVNYSISKPIIEPIEIDFSKELIGVIEYLQKGIKKSIFRDRIIKETSSITKK